MPWVFNGFPPSPAPLTSLSPQPHSGTRVPLSIRELFIQEASIEKMVYFIWRIIFALSLCLEQIILLFIYITVYNSCPGGGKMSFFQEASTLHINILTNEFIKSQIIR